METGTRVYRFVITSEVEPGHEAYDGPEWAADAAWGALTNMYGLLTSWSGIEELDPGGRNRLIHLAGQISPKRAS